MSFVREFPIDIGTFVTIKDTGGLGIVRSYQSVTNDPNEERINVCLVKYDWCTEYTIDEVRVATNEEIRQYIKGRK